MEEKRETLLNRILVHRVTGELLVGYDFREVLYDTGSNFLILKISPVLSTLLGFTRIIKGAQLQMPIGQAVKDILTQTGRPGEKIMSEL